MSEQGNENFSPERVSRNYTFSAILLAVLIGAAAFIHVTVQAQQKTLAAVTAGAQNEFAMTQRVAMLTAQYQVTHDEALLPLIKQAATTTLSEQEKLSPVMLPALSQGLDSQESMAAGALDGKVRQLVNLAFFFSGNPEGADSKTNADAIADLARQDLASAWQGAVDSYEASAQKGIALFTNIGFGLYAAMLLIIFYELNGLVRPMAAHIRAQRDHLEHMGSTDMLTGLYNRAMLFKVVSTMISGAKRHKQPLAVLAVDIDDFKSINDRFGRAAGDSIIRKVSAVLNEALRTSDVMGRVAGQEFAVFLPSTDEYRASFVAEKLRSLVENANLSVKEHVVLARVSIGVADLQPQFKSTDDLLRAAEAALKIAKESGRNRVATLTGAVGATPAVAPPAAAPAT